MKKFIRIISYIKEYKAYMSLYTLFISLSIVFSLFSLSMLVPFMDLIFGSSELSGVAKVATANSGSLKDSLYTFLQNNIIQYGKLAALGWICIGIVTAVLFKNLFLYLSFYFLAPIRNAVTRKYSKLLYNKILQLPIGYFTEQRKGDILSRSLALCC